MDEFSQLVHDYYTATIEEDEAEKERVRSSVRDVVILLLLLYGKRNLGFIIGMLTEDGAEVPSDVSYSPSEELINQYTQDIQEVLSGLSVRMEEAKRKARQEQPDLSEDEIKVLVLGAYLWQVQRIVDSYDSILEDATTLDIVNSTFRQIGGSITKTWVAKIDSKTCPVCRALDGTTIGLNENFVYNGVGVTLSSHYDNVAMAHSNCRCHLEYNYERK